MAEIASQRWGDKDSPENKNLVKQCQTSPTSFNGEEPMIIATSDVTSSISSSSRDDSSSSYKESSANSSDHESNSHPALPMLSSPSSSSCTRPEIGMKTSDNTSSDIFTGKSFPKCATLPNRKSSSTKKSDNIRTATMLKKVIGSFTNSRIYMALYKK